MNKSPCLACELVSEDKNKCLENCDKLKQYQELILKQGIYAKITAVIKRRPSGRLFYLDLR